MRRREAESHSIPRAAWRSWMSGRSMSGVNGATTGDPVAAVRSALPQLYTLREAARILRCGQSTLRGAARRRQIGHLRQGRRLMFSEADLAAYIGARRVEAA